MLRIGLYDMHRMHRGNKDGLDKIHPGTKLGIPTPLPEGSQSRGASNSSLLFIVQ